MHFHHHRGREGSNRNTGASSDLALPSEPSKEFRLLTPTTIRFHREGSKLAIRFEGEGTSTAVSLFRLFPLSEPDHWLSVVDEKGRELGIVTALGELDKDSQKEVRAELVRRYTVPQILRIIVCREKYDVIEWEVETDRGVRKFVVRNIRENIQRPSANRLILTDAEGNRFDIPDLLALDLQSRLMLERYA